MISRGLKAFFYTLFHIPMRLNGMIYKTFPAPSKGVVKVHLGPGTIKYFPGWINVDANLFTAKIDVWADLSNPLPFRDQSVDVFYSHHVIEHFPDQFLPTHFKELFRCLKPGGFVPSVVPMAKRRCGSFSKAMRPGSRIFRIIEKASAAGSSILSFAGTST